MRRDAAPAFAAWCRSLPPSEIVLERLIDTLVVLAVEHAEAERGLLILPRGNELRIEAETTTGRETVTVRLRREGVSGSELPESVLHYVIRTQEPVMLDDASAQNLFSAGAYLRQTHARSVICLPLVKQARRIGVQQQAAPAPAIQAEHGPEPASVCAAAAEGTCHDRKTNAQSLGVTCFDCHVNGHTNGTFHLNPDNRPQAARFRIDTVSLRGMFNQKIHGSKRSLRSVEDFTEFEQRTAYFDGDQVTAAKKGVHLPDRASQVVMMAQMQDMFDFPPAPKLTLLGILDPAQATEEELLGQEVFFGKGQCAVCHPAPFYLDDKMHNLKVERFYTPRTINGEWIHAEGPIKTFTLRGIKDSPPYLHDGRLLTLEDTVEFFNLVLGVQLMPREKAALVAFMRQL